MSLVYVSNTPRECGIWHEFDTLSIDFRNITLNTIFRFNCTLENIYVLQFVCQGTETEIGYGESQLEKFLVKACGS